MPSLNTMMNFRRNIQPRSVKWIKLSVSQSDLNDLVPDYKPGIFSLSREESKQFLWPTNFEIISGLKKLSGYYLLANVFLCFFFVFVNHLFLNRNFLLLKQLWYKNNRRYWVCCKDIRFINNSLNKLIAKIK